MNVSNLSDPILFLAMLFFNFFQTQIFVRNFEFMIISDGVDLFIMRFFTNRT
jgi:hypothetical protein